MRLVDLGPRWIERDGQQLGLVLRCPHCRAMWLTCWLAPMSHHDQMAALGASGFALDEDGWLEDSDTVVLCNPSARWQIVGGSTFDDLTITPSLDASASGHWHGHIQGGEIR